MNEQNLRTPTSAEAREIGRKGGIASGKARLAKKHGRELVRALLSMPEADPRVLEEIQKAGILTKDVTNEVAMHVRQLQKAKAKADTNAYNAVLKAAGYLAEDQNLNITATTTQVIVSSPETAEHLANLRKAKK